MPLSQEDLKIIESVLDMSQKLGLLAEEPLPLTPDDVTLLRDVYDRGMDDHDGQWIANLRHAMLRSKLPLGEWPGPGLTRPFWPQRGN